MDGEKRSWRGSHGRKASAARQADGGAEFCGDANRCCFGVRSVNRHTHAEAEAEAAAVRRGRYTASVQVRAM